MEERKKERRGTKLLVPALPPSPCSARSPQPLPAPAKPSLGTVAHITRFTYKSKHRYTRGSGSVFARVLSALGPTYPRRSHRCHHFAAPPYCSELSLPCLDILLSYPLQPISSSHNVESFACCPYRYYVELLLAAAHTASAYC